MRPARVRLKDVARAAGVSVSTASSALSAPREGGTTRLSEGTRQRVREAARVLGYVPSTAARGLVTGASGRVAIVLPNLHQPYFSRMAGMLISELAAAGLRSTVLLTEDDPGRERDATLGLVTRDVEGVLVCPHHLTDELLGGREPTLPLVQVGGLDVRGVVRVAMDEYGGALAAARHLIDAGRRRIAYVVRLGGDGGPRFAAYRAALDEAGLPLDEALVVDGEDWDRGDTGMEATIGLLRSGAQVDALMCINDAVAVGALRALLAAGLRVPEDVAVTGFDNTVEGQYAVPALTTVEPGTDVMARSAVAQLVARIRGSEPPPVEEAPTRLVVRASSQAG